MGRPTTQLPPVSARGCRSSWRPRLPESNTSTESFIIPHAALPLDTWSHVFELLGDREDNALSRAQLTMAASVAFALRRLPPSEMAFQGRGRDGRLCIWIVGAREAMEGELARGGNLGEPLARLCPPELLASRGLEIVLIGPEMSPWEVTGNANVLIRSLAGTLHAVKATEQPDLAVLYNSGIGTLLYPLVEQWLPSIAQLLALSNVPLLLTCFNEHEARGEEAIIGGAFESRTLLESMRNPIAHATPLLSVAVSSDYDEALQAAIDAEAVCAKDEEAELADKAQKAALCVADQGSTPEAAAAAAVRPSASPPEASRSNNWVKCYLGSSLDVDALNGSAQQKAIDLVKMCAKMFAFKNMDAWLEGIDKAGAAAVNEKNGSAPQQSRLIFDSESLAANVLLLAEATAEPALALLANQKGALQKLSAVLQRMSFQLKSPESRSTSKEHTYSGVTAEERIQQGIIDCVRNIQAAIEEANALEKTPVQEEAPLSSGPTTYRNVFKGQYINVRADPSTHGKVVARLPPDATMIAEAERGGWLRLRADPKSGVPANAWALVRHPVHGPLIAPVESE